MQPQTGCAAPRKKLTGETQLHNMHITENYQILEESQHHNRVRIEKFWEVELIDKLNRMLWQVKLILTERFKSILHALKCHKSTK